MHQVYGKIAISQQNAKQDIRQPQAEQTIRQPQAEMTIERSRRVFQLIRPTHGTIRT
ncbi:DUF6470 family protein [Terrilactibacillus sp. S3-3]|nr:DUF6470 family protein [Terrilactibacillus sp. S3-3]